MLPARLRLRDRQKLQLTVRQGTRAGRRYLVVHYLAPAAAGQESPKVAFAVGKGVGNSVVRHAVIRRLRHVVIATADQLPAGSTLVIRALPDAATATSDDLTTDLLAALQRVAPVAVSGGAA